MRKILIYIASLIYLSSCENEYLNPSSASEQQVINSQSGLLTLVNGLQQKFTIGRIGVIYTSITADGLTTKQLKVLNAGNTDEVLLESGGTALINNNLIINSLWSQAHLIKSNADLIIANIQKAPDPGTKAGILAAAHMYRALALGTLATYWKQIPITVGYNASFNSRAEALTEAIKSLEMASAALATPLSSTFMSNFVPAVDLGNTIAALTARYQNMLGNHDAAIFAASKVDQTVKSAFNFDKDSPNPVFFNSFGNRNVTEPVSDFGLSGLLIPNENDKRKAFYYSTGGKINLGQAGFFTSNTQAIPVYLPSEMVLIKAEALAHKGQLNEAIIELNKVLTKTNDPFGVNASGTAYNGAITADTILIEIYKQRCAELFLSGMRLEDSRRFNRPQNERNRDWYPYPLSERNNNKNTPADPER